MVEKNPGEYDIRTPPTGTLWKSGADGPIWCFIRIRGTRRVLRLYYAVECSKTHLRLPQFGRRHFPPRQTVPETAMPIYEYQCNTCGHELEKLQRMSDDVLKNCPACEEPELKRLISAAAFRLKGSGWYETDFKKDNQRNLVESSGAESAAVESSGVDSSGSKQKDSASGTAPSGSAKPKTDKSTDAKSAAVVKTESAGKSTTA